MSAPIAERGKWGSNFGFILAAAGSAIGLGNIWGFPYKASQSGGAAFVLVYLLCVAFLGIPIMLAELSIGRASEKSPVGAFRKLAPSSWWPLVGGFGVLTGFAILAFYAVIAGWTLAYLYKAISGTFSDGLTIDQAKGIFAALTNSGGMVTLWAAIFFLLTILVVRGGVRGGIELASKILMPVFLVLLILLAIRSATLPGGEKGLAYLFNVDFSKITPRVVLLGLGQALFSLSLGMGAMITYGSYLQRKQNLARAGVIVGLADTMIALLAGIIIFPALFAAGAEPTESVGLVFFVLPTIFDQMPYGNLFAIAFYGLLAIAALTSTISLLEVIVAYFVDERQWSREKAAWLLGLACFLVAAGCAFWGPLMDWLIKLFSELALAIGALLICLFVGWRWTPASAIAEMRAEGGRFPGLPLWAFLVRFVCPIVVAVILVFTAIREFGGA